MMEKPLKGSYLSLQHTGYFPKNSVPECPTAALLPFDISPKGQVTKNLRRYCDFSICVLLNFLQVSSFFANKSADKVVMCQDLQGNFFCTVMEVTPSETFGDQSTTFYANYGQILFSQKYPQLPFACFHWVQNKFRCNGLLSTITCSLIATYLELNKAQTEVTRAVGKEEIYLKAFSEGSELVMLALTKSCQLLKKLPYLLQFTSKSQPDNN